MRSWLNALLMSRGIYALSIRYTNMLDRLLLNASMLGVSSTRGFPSGGIANAELRHEVDRRSKNETCILLTASNNRSTTEHRKAGNTGNRDRNALIRLGGRINALDEATCDRAHLFEISSPGRNTSGALINKHRI